MYLHALNLFLKATNTSIECADPEQEICYVSDVTF